MWHCVAALARLTHHHVHNCTYPISLMWLLRHVMLAMLWGRNVTRSLAFVQTQLCLRVLRQTAAMCTVVSSRKRLCLTDVVCSTLSEGGPRSWKGVSFIGRPDLRQAGIVSADVSIILIKI